MNRAGEFTREQYQTVADIIAERDALRARLEVAERMAQALVAAVLAMRAPIDGWKGEVERAALDKANPALAEWEALK